MKGMISAIKRMEIHDGEGLRTTVFFKGCPLRCLWCHNPESIGFDPQTAHQTEKCISCGACVCACPQHAIVLDQEGLTIDRSRCVTCGACSDACPTGAMMLYGREYDAEELDALVARDQPFFERSGGGVTLSGGECLSQPDFAVEVARLLHTRGISVDIDTCGYVEREVLDRILPHTDTFLYDLKAIDACVHKRCTGRNNERILDNLRYLSEQGARIEIRYPLVMGYNDGECDKIGAFLQNLQGITKVKVLQFHPFAASRYESLAMPCTVPDTITTVEDVQRAVDALKTFGLNAVNGAIED